MNEVIKNKIYNEEQCIDIQEKLSEKIIINSKIQIESISKIAGIDLAYWKKDDYEYAVCCIVVINSVTKEVIENVHSVGKIEFPYIPGCLAFRELPLVLETVEKLQSKPNLYIFDGNGYLYPRHMGIATHAGIYLNKPTIGVAKSYYKVDNTDFIMPGNIEGAYTDIVIHGEIYGRVLRTHKDVKPIFLSVGNHIDLEASTQIIKSLVTKESHIPIPTRLADIETHKMRDVYKSNI
ncbi:endonuclease V [Clostridium argentinense]|uniref:endonuclease V n=1 Tax=Clostridium argentinense TaxID=29341 RepID=UPI00057DA5EC|nr:endonuclease V [Clostridium argentinense]NFF39105.1 endonuclease V [Clostridium argentinense]NFP49517.1 endonuclease V [Clostridium argentinense]NFP72220.1 endonuclease V [Clostridium argentinense]NFP76391.1 endonuclease V [Clostridium argentinense]